MSLDELKKLARIIINRHDTGVEDIDARVYQLATGVLELKKPLRKKK